MKNLTQQEANVKLTDELKNLTPQEIIKQYSNKPFFELEEAEKDAVINAFKIQTLNKAK